MLAGRPRPAKQLSMKNKVLIAVAAVATVLFLAFFPIFTAVQLTAVKTGEKVLLFPLTEGEEFSVRFTHSVNRRPVQDFLTVRDGGFVVLRSRYDAFGAGMPVADEEGARLIIRPDTSLELIDINRRLNEFTVFAGTVADHHVEVRGTLFRLSELVKPGEPVKFQVTKLSYLQWQKGRYSP